MRRNGASAAGVAEVELDLGRYELRRRGRRVKLEKKPMEMLILLVSRREQLVSRNEIVRKLWGSGLFVDPQPNINNIVRKIRTALGDLSAKPRFVETVVGKGYRFVGSIRIIEAQYPQAGLREDSTHRHLLPRVEDRGERTSLAVLPLLLDGGAPDDHGLCLGVADALVSRLANLQGVDVLPTTTVMNMEPDATAQEIAPRLGVRFVVSGAIQVFKGQWRLSMEMYDSHWQRSCLSKKCDLRMDRLAEVEDEIARQIAGTLHRSLGPPVPLRQQRYSNDAMAYSEFVRGYRLSSSVDSGQMEDAATHLTNAVTRDPGFSLAHAELSFVCATRHFETDPANVWLEKAEFHCQRALELDPQLAEGHVARAFLLWGPSKNFQHLEAIAELKHALALRKNLPHAYNRLGTILAHIGLLDHARAMYERARPFHPQKAVSHSIAQVYMWNHEFDLARDELEAWRAESPRNKYPAYFAPLVAMMAEDWKEAKRLLAEALETMPDEPAIISLQGVLCAMKGKEGEALECMTKACAIPKSFGHSHHTYYQIAEILSLLGRCPAALEWLERSVSTGFACWPFFLKDPSLKNLRELPDFEVLVSSLQAKYPDRLGIF